MKKEEINRLIGERLSSIRKSKGFTQSDLAEKIGFSRGHLSCVEIGDAEIGTVFLYKCCLVLRCEPKNILPSINELTNSILL